MDVVARPRLSVVVNFLNDFDDLFFTNRLVVDNFGDLNDFFFSVHGHLSTKI